MIKKYKIGSVFSNPYLTDEKIIGRWIDGSSIYRKVIKIENVSNGTTNIDVSELNIKEVISMSGRRNKVSSSKDYIFQLPYTYNTSNYYYFFYSKDTVNMKTIGDTSDSIILYLEYTKNE